MPILSSVRRTGRCEFSTSRMISSFSQAGYRAEDEARSVATV
jgi:hypothetical protein